MNNQHQQENLDNKILRALYVHHCKSPGKHQMKWPIFLRELGELDTKTVREKVDELKETKRWVDYAVTEDWKAGVIWLTIEGIEVAEQFPPDGISEIYQSIPQEDESDESHSPEGFVPGYKYDIFISYAKADELWVETLIEGIKAYLASLLGTATKFSLWKSPDTLITSIRPEEFRATATFLLFLSNKYLEEVRCCREAQEILDCAKNVAEQPKRVFLLELEPLLKLEPLYVIKLLQKLRGRERTRRFWRGKTETGWYTLAKLLASSGADDFQSEQDRPYSDQLNELGRDLTTALKQMVAPVLPDQTHTCPSVFLAEVPDDLYWERESIRRTLAQEQIRVLPETNMCTEYQYLHDFQSYKQGIEENLKTSTLFVQLINASSGRTPEGRSGIVRCQYDFAQERAKKILQWKPKLDIEQIEDKNLKHLLQNSTVQATSLHDFTALVVERVNERESCIRQVKPQRNQSLLVAERALLVAERVNERETFVQQAEQQGNQSFEEFMLFYNAHPKDFEFTEKTVKENVKREFGNIDSIIFSSEAIDIAILERRFSAYDGLIFVYRQQTEWLYTELPLCRRVIYRLDNPLVLGLYDGPPEHKHEEQDPRNIVDIKNMHHFFCRQRFDKKQLRPFFEDMQRAIKDE